MPGDYSRKAPNPVRKLPDRKLPDGTIQDGGVELRDFSDVLMQQGRVQLDADWNELVETIDRRLRAETIDIIGRGTVPKETPDGFKIEITGGALTIGRGRIYVDGLLAENHGKQPLEFDPVLAEQRGTLAVPYEEQPYFPNAPIPPKGKPHLVYLDVWQREVTYLQVPDLVEKAVGVDTATRLQTVWQVRVLEDVTNIPCGTPDNDINCWLHIIRPSDGRLSTKAVGVASVDDPCVIPPSGGYRGLENRLYRVEIHDGGYDQDAKPIKPTFKWSRDNASVATSVTVITALDKLTVARVGRDNTLRFSVGDWIEITDDWLEFAQQPGFMRQIKAVDDATQVITLTAALPTGTFPTDGQGNTDSERHTRIMRWDQNGKVFDTNNNLLVNLDAPGSTGVIPVPAEGTSIILEDGVQITFNTPDKIDDPPPPNHKRPGVYLVGDFWCFTARTADASVEELVEAPPRGIHHHYCRLAIVTIPNAAADCRHVCGPCQAMHVTGINWKNDDVLPLESQYIRRRFVPPDTATFAGGLKITLDTAPDETSVVPATMIVTMEIPLTFLERGLPGAGNAPDFGLSFILRGNISVLESTITWKPMPETVTFVRDLLKRLERSQKVPSIIVRVSLNGFAIFSDRDNPRMNLDGQALGIPRALSPPYYPYYPYYSYHPYYSYGTYYTYYAAGRIDLIFPSHNCKCASNFESWFFLGSAPYTYFNGFGGKFVGIGEEQI
jgi:hypothetical protein